MRCSVSNSGRNGQLRFCAGTRFAPEFHSRADAFRAREIFPSLFFSVISNSQRYLQNYLTPQTAAALCRTTLIRCQSQSSTMSSYRTLPDVTTHQLRLQRKSLRWTPLSSGTASGTKNLAFGSWIEHEFHGGANARDCNMYFNKRAEVWGLMRDWLKAGTEIPDDPELANDLTAPGYATAGGKRFHGSIMLESKDDLKARGEASPDDGDTLA
jgi:hypothetical protein